MTNRIFGRSTPLFKNQPTTYPSQQPSHLTKDRFKQLGLDLEQGLSELETRFRNQCQKIPLVHRLRPAKMQSHQIGTEKSSCDEFDFEIDVRWL